MKNASATLIALSLSLAVFHVGSAADSTGSKPGTTATEASQQTYSATGVVKSIDATNGKVTISHDAIKSLQWPAMTMGFTVRDKALLGNLSVGKKVDFQLIKQGNEYVIVDVK